MSLLQGDTLERIAYRKVDSLAVLEFRYVVETALACLVRYVQTYAPVKTEHEEFEVIA